MPSNSASHQVPNSVQRSIYFFNLLKTSTVHVWSLNINLTIVIIGINQEELRIMH